MDLKDLDRIRFVTRHFQDLQGLRFLVPLGMISLLQGCSPFFLHAPVLLGLLAILLQSRARKHYSALLGEVEGRQKMTTAVWFVWLPIGLMLAVGLLFSFFPMGALSVPRAQGVIYGAVLLGLWLRRGQRGSQSYQLLLGGLLVGVAVLAPKGSASVRQEAMDVLTGTCWILAGLLDHRQLIETLGHLPAASLEEDAAAETAEAR